MDAIDLVSCKLDLAETARRLGIPLIMALGTGNKLDPTQLRLADLSETYGCPLARVMRKSCAAGASSIKKWYSARRSQPPRNSWRPPLPGAAASRPAILGSLPPPDCCWAAPWCGIF